MKRNLLSLFLFMALAAVGCSLTPDYQRPKAPVNAAWPGTPTGEAVSAAPASALPWRDFFTDPGLQRVIETALENNRDLRLAVLNVKRARALYGIQRASLLPSVNAAASSAHSRVPADLSSTGGVSQPEEYRVDFGTTAWEIDFFGRVQSLKDQALEEYLATEEARRGARISLVATVAQSYLSLAGDREQLDLALSTLAAQEETLGLIRRQVEAGLASRLDLRRAETQVDAAKDEIARLVQRTAEDRNALNLLMGDGSAIADEHLPKGLSDVRSMGAVAAGLPSETLLDRPDVMAEEHRLKAANANIGAARAAFFPRIVLTARAGTASGELSRLFHSGQGTWSFAPSITLPIFDTRTWSAYDLTQAEKEIALVRYEKTLQTAFREVADALAAKENLQPRLTARRALVESLADAHRLARVRYDNGIDSYLSVLDAQRSLYAARQGLVAIHLAELANRVVLYAALGGGGI